MCGSGVRKRFSCRYRDGRHGHILGTPSVEVEVSYEGGYTEQKEKALLVQWTNKRCLRRGTREVGNSKRITSLKVGL